MDVLSWQFLDPCGSPCGAAQEDPSACPKTEVTAPQVVVMGTEQPEAALLGGSHSARFPLCCPLGDAQVTASVPHLGGLHL